MIPMYKNKGGIQNYNNLQGHQFAKPHYEGLGESGRDAGEETGVHLQESIQIHAGVIEY